MNQRSCLSYRWCNPADEVVAPPNGHIQRYGTDHSCCQVQYRGAAIKTYSLWIKKKRERERETLFYMKLCRLIYISSNIIYSNLLTRIFHGIWGILVWAMVRYKRKRMTVSTQQKTDTNITHPSAGTWRYSVPPIKVHTRSPNTWYWRWNTDTHTTETALFFW